MKTPGWGFVEVGFWAGEDFPRPLPYCMFDVARSFEAKIGGARPEDVEKLLSALDALFGRPVDSSGLTNEIDVELLSDSEPGMTEIQKDPEFYPRVSLRPTGRLSLLARSHSEAKVFGEQLAKLWSTGALRKRNGWKSWEIMAGTPHHIIVAVRQTEKQRVVAKIVYALLVQSTLQMPGQPEAELVRRYAIDGELEGSALVESISEPNTLKFWPEHHAAAIFSFEDRTIGVVSIHGDCHLVHLVYKSGQELHVAALSSRTGGSTRRLTGDAAAAMLTSFRAHLLKQDRRYSPD